MKKINLIVWLLLSLLMLTSLCACKGAGDGDSVPVDHKIRAAVMSRADFEYYGASIGGNELKSSTATISNIKKVSDTEYKVSGKIIMTDVYGTKWSNNFDCEVTTSNGEKWVAGSFNYTSGKWNKH